MRRLRASLIRFLGLFRRRQHEAELNAELQAHLDGLTERNLAKGLSPAEAREAALRAFGGLAQIAEQSRDQRRSLWLEQLGQDVHYAWRQFGRSRGFTAIVVLTLALGIGANTAIFSVVDTILFRPLSYPGGERLVVLSHSNPRTGERYLGVSAAGFAYYQANARSFEHLAAIGTWEATLTNQGDAEQLQGVRTSPALFGALGTEPALGRVFAAGEDVPGRNRVVVLSDSLWQRRFGGDPHVLGRSIMLDGDAYTIIGVMPATFQFGREVGHVWEIWAPIAFTPAQLAPAAWRNESLLVIGRLRRDQSLAEARSELDVMTAQVRRQFLGGENSSAAANWGLGLDPVLEETVGTVRPTLLVLLGAVALVLLIACVNVANLLLARVAVRGRELALRMALGASRGRMVRQLLTESSLLALAGCGLGVLLAHWGVPLLRQLAGDRLPRGHEMGVDLRVLGFAVAVSLLTGVVFGLAPAWRATRTAPAEMLKQGGRGFTARAGLRGTLIVSEIALALVLLVGAGLLFKSFARLLDIRPGFRPDHLLVARLAPPAAKYRDPRQLDEFFTRVLAGVRALPGVEAAAVSTQLPMSDSGSQTSAIAIAGRPSGPDEPATGGSRWHVSSGYFQAMEIPVLRGRGFDDRDHAGAALVAVIDETMARKFWPDQDPIGQRISLGSQRDAGGNPLWREIVGVVGHVKHDGLEHETPPQYYLPQRQMPERTVFLVVRTALEPTAMVTAVRGVIRNVDDSIPLYDQTTMEQMMSFSLAPRRFALSLLGGFAFLALGLAAIGLYGVISYLVTQRTREFGVRLALGAGGRDIQLLVLRQGLKLAVLGVILGLAGAVAASRLIRQLLFGVSPTDPLTFALIPCLLVAIAVLACLIPARRAAKVDPMIALRAE